MLKQFMHDLASVTRRDAALCLGVVCLFLVILPAHSDLSKHDLFIGFVLVLATMKTWIWLKEPLY